ncbi:MAG TPA: response regulator [Nitrososphaera sp.]|nr:response regulator [Nitrososphaera sp.]
MAAAGGGSSNAIKFRVLLVDDEPDITTVMQSALEREGFLVDSFNDSQQALDAFRLDYYDIALLDIRMPVLNGFELYRELKKKDGRIKVCFITAFEVYYDEFKRLFPSVSATCFVKKPVALHVLVKLIRQELESDKGT